jgi:uncharacterized protein
MTVMPGNVPRLLEDVRGLYDLGVNQFLIGHATGVTWNAADIAGYQEQMRLLLRWYRQQQRRDLVIAEFEGGAGPLPRFGCQAGRDSVSISASGEISSCSKILALDNKKLIGKLGDVRYGVTHLLNRGHLVGCAQLRTNCEAAGIADDYAGGCFATNYDENGDLFHPSLQDHAISLAKRAAHQHATGGDL